MTDLDAYAVCAPGLEAIVAEELVGLGLTVTGTERGGVALRTDLAGLYRANLESRIATRILLRLATFRARTFPDLLKHTAALPWEAYLAAGTPVAVKTSSRASRLYILKRIEATVTEAIASRTGSPLADGANPPPLPVPPPQGGRRLNPRRSAKCLATDGRRKPGSTDLAPHPRSKFPLPSVGGGQGEGVPGSPPQQVLVRLVNNQCTISLDTSGELLHRRGYRLATAKAPLRETLACAVLQLCGWSPDTPLIDPFCGAGTFAIEAARWALGIPPAWDRPFAFQAWPSLDRPAWESLRDEAAAARRTVLAAPITGSDHDPGAVRIARDNARRAGVADCLPIDQRDFFDLRPDGRPGLVVINAPYGRRIAPGNLRTLHRRLGAHLRTQFPAWRYALLCGSPSLARATGLPVTQTHTLPHGGRPVTLITGTL